MEEFYIAFPIAFILGLPISFIILLSMFRFEEHTENTIKAKIGWFLLTDASKLYSTLSYKFKNVTKCNEFHNLVINSEDEYNRALVVLKDFQCHNKELFFITLRRLTSRQKRNFKKISKEDLFLYYLLDYLDCNNKSPLIDATISRKLLYMVLLSTRHNEHLCDKWLNSSALDSLIEITAKTISTSSNNTD